MRTRCTKDGRWGAESAAAGIYKWFRFRGLRDWDLVGKFRRNGYLFSCPHLAVDLLIGFCREFLCGQRTWGVKLTFECFGPEIGDEQ